jgi:hypothetical protein
LPFLEKVTLQILLLLNQLYPEYSMEVNAIKLPQVKRGFFDEQITAFSKASALHDLTSVTVPHHANCSRIKGTARNEGSETGSKSPVPLVASENNAGISRPAEKVITQPTATSAPSSMPAPAQVSATSPKEITAPTRISTPVRSMTFSSLRSKSMVSKSNKIKYLLCNEERVCMAGIVTKQNALFAHILYDMILVVNKNFHMDPSKQSSAPIMRLLLVDANTYKLVTKIVWAKLAQKGRSVKYPVISAVSSILRITTKRFP